VASNRRREKGDLLKVKLLVRKGPGLLAISDNKAEIPNPMEVDMTQFRLIGKVVRIGHMVKRVAEKNRWKGYMIIMRHLAAGMMKRSYLKLILAFVFITLFPLSIHAYDVPELIYYKFDNAGGSTVMNEASAPVGTNPAPVSGQTMGGTGQFGSALIGNGGSSTTNRVNTGWATNLGSGSWTISCWLNNIPNDTTLYYIFGDASASSFRCFFGGVAGAGNIIIRGGGLSDLIVAGVASAQPSVLHFVYDSDADEIRGYLNGELKTTVPDSSTDVTGTGPFTVGGYSTSTGLPNGGLLDEFRVYSRALSTQEIADTWNVGLPSQPSPTVIPTLSEWGMAILSILLIVTAVVIIRRRKATI